MARSCFCGHGYSAHEMNGACTFRGCKCWHYDALAAGQGVLRSGVTRVAADYAMQRNRNSTAAQRQLVEE